MLSMDHKRVICFGIGALLSLMLACVSMSLVFADDGVLLVSNVSSESDLPQTPEPEGEHDSIKLMNFYVPAQRADGTLESIFYYNSDGMLTKTENKAKPLIAFYTFGPVIRFVHPQPPAFQAMAGAMPTRQ